MSKFPNLSTLLSRRSNPSILPISPTRAGNNKPKSLQKTKRTFKPNVTRVDWPINLLSETVGTDKDVLPKLRGVKMQMRRVRDVEKAGGSEGLLLSRASKDLTPFGAYLRSQVFNQLHRIKIDLEAEKRAEAGLPLESGLSGASPIEEAQKAQVPLVEGQ
ncbi:uncharacterized protein I206_105586 [Kwoniella pini CBS 10737]|uniref:Uncharacterized protein n=1 Tax=Kwoniella pini CBS 10737 TaxID=1296096 RepID=A0A1B9I3T8_9TREE|nr:uncharacterized protein I206_03513 [Kwoniella pini CBS 10737]OCF50194.1 hypothetical protein I206_03513 [Kwoniella pini CBS 10737]